MFDPKTSKYIDFKSIKKLLIVRLGKIGDLVVTSFVFEILKKEYPHLEIHLLTLESNRDVLKHNPRLTKIIYTKKNILLYLKVLKLRNNHFDMILDFNDNPSSTSTFIFKYIKAHAKVGYDFPKYRGQINFKISPLAKENSHIIDRMKNFLIELGIHTDDKLVKPYFYVTSEVMNEVTDEIKIRINDKVLIAVNLSAGAIIRYWSVENWVNLISSISNTYKNLSFLLLSTDEDKSMKDQIAQIIDSENCVVSRYSSIQHLAAYIKSSNLLITPDTSAVHIASAVGIPTIALYPNPEWNYISWQPYKVAHRSIKSSTETVNGISVVEVFTNFKSLINEIGLS